MPYTSHGHWFGGGSPALPEPLAVAKCGGPGMCNVCSKEAAAASAAPRVERDDDGHPVWIHVCTAASPGFDAVIPAKLPLGPNGWEWTADGGLTPSILCRNCGIHGFWMGGENPNFRLC